MVARYDPQSRMAETKADYFEAKGY